jgi:hypothetical protein
VVFAGGSYGADGDRVHIAAQIHYKIFGMEPVKLEFWNPFSTDKFLNIGMLIFYRACYRFLKISEKSRVLFPKFSQFFRDFLLDKRFKIV